MSTFTDGLRAMAAFLDSHPEVEPYDCILDTYMDADEFKMASWTFGTAQKRADSGTMSLVKTFSGDKDATYGKGIVRLSISTSRSNVCTRKVIGTEMVEVTDYSIPQPKKMVEREIVEWECSPLLAQ